MWCEFENYEFNITGESPKRQWVNGLRQRQDARHFQDVFMKLNAFVIDETVNLSFKRHRSLFLRLHLTPIIHYMTVIILINDAIMASLDRNGPLTRYVKLRVTHAPGMLETFSPPPRTQKETTSWLSRYASRHVREKPMDFLSHYQGSPPRPWPQEMTVFSGQRWHLDPPFTCADKDLCR